jgi:hypothetical protein
MPGRPAELDEAPRLAVEVAPPVDGWLAEDGRLAEEEAAGLVDAGREALGALFLFCPWAKVTPHSAMYSVRKGIVLRMLLIIVLPGG